MQQQQKRIRHYTEWLHQVGGIPGIPGIPSKVALMDLIRLELRGRPVNDDTVHRALKRLRPNKLYGHDRYIVRQLGGPPGAFLDAELMQELMRMFETIQVPFRELFPMRSLPSYCYITHKCLELLGWHEHVPLFPMPPCTAKVLMQDVMWKALASAVGWEFLPSQSA